MTYGRSAALVALAVALGTTPALAAKSQETYRLEQDQWQKQEVLDPGTPQGELQRVRKLLAEDKNKLAGKRASEWIEHYPNHPELAEAHLLRGDALVARRYYFKALFDYEHVAQVHPQSEQFHTALEREFEIAKLFAAGMKRRWLAGVRMLPASDEAEELFIRVQERSPGSEVGEKASLALGEFYFNRAQMGSAAEAYQLFLVNYPDSRYRQRAMLRLIQSNLATFKGPRFDSTGLIEAAQRLKTFRKEYPVSAQRLGAQALLVRIDESLALQDFYRARWYDRVGQRVSAVYTYRRVVSDRPQTVAARAAMQRLAGLAAPLQSPGHTPDTPDDALDTMPSSDESEKIR